MKRVVHAVCSHDCPDSCATLITVEDGRATRLQGDPKHPVTRGFLCAKVAKYLDRVYSPDRVLYPMRRRKGFPKGPIATARGERRQDAAATAGETPALRAGDPAEGGRATQAFERITWEQALDEIAARFQRISKEFGPEAILPYSYAGNSGALGYGSMDRRFFHRLGASQLDRTICATAGGEALLSVYGRKLATEPEQFRHSKLILAWGANIHGANVHLWPFIEEARRAGGKLVVIDPYRTRTARCADWYLPINPGTDVALALGMMHVIIGENLHDADYVERYTEGFEQLRERVLEYPPERVAGWTGIAAGDIARLAREYATVRPASIRVNYGIQRSENGGMAMRAVAMLPCITGSWKEVGGGLQLSTSGAFPIDKGALERHDLMLRSPLGRPSRTINMSQLGEVLNSQADPPVKALFVYNSNPAAIAPNHNAVVRGMRRDDLFTVVHEQFFTDTTDYADLVLPATTFFEHKDLQVAYGHHYLQVSHQAIDPLGECRSNVETFRALALRMGFDEPCFRESVEEMMDAALASGHPWLEGLDRERLERDPYTRLNFGSDPFLPFAEGGFGTPSGKALLYNQRLAEQGLDPVASFIPPSESRHTAEARRYPLELLARKADNFLNSTFTNLPTIQKMEERDLLEISAADAAVRGIRDGQRVRVFNDRGEIFLTARVDGVVQPGVVGARLSWAKLTEGGRNINVLTSEKLTDIGAAATFYSVLVEVESVVSGQWPGTHLPCNAAATQASNGRMKTMRFLMGLLVTGSLLAIALASGRSDDVAASEPAPGEARGPVLVELFTSEGCSSCPPADALLMRLDQAARVAGAEVIVLSEHVDYWNYIGWTDPFSSSEYSERQRTYARTLNGEVYTPQMVVDGQEGFVGSDERRARAAIARASRKPKASVEIQPAGRTDDGRLVLAVRVADLPKGAAGETADLLVALTEGNLTVAVPRGENSGRKLSHTSVVRRLERVAKLDGKHEFSTKLKVPLASGWKLQDLRAVAIVQERRSGQVLGVGQVRLGAE